jgi:putative transposase
MEAMGRKHPRLHGYDYNQEGIYFLTFCTANRAKTLSSVVGRDDLGTPAVVALTGIGRIVEKNIGLISKFYPDAVVDNYVIMPNHVHLIIRLSSLPEGAPRSSRPTERIPRIISAIKRFTNKEAGMNLWQVSYHDHIIRDESDYLTRYQYIDNNAAKWVEDEYYG